MNILEQLLVLRHCRWGGNTVQLQLRSRECLLKDFAERSLWTKMLFVVCAEAPLTPKLGECILLQQYVKDIWKKKRGKVLAIESKSITEQKRIIASC